MKKLNLYISSIFQGLYSTEPSATGARIIVYTLKFCFASEITIFIGLAIKSVIGQDSFDKNAIISLLAIGLLFVFSLWRIHVFIENRTDPSKYKTAVFEPSKAWINLIIGSTILLSPLIIFALVVIWTAK